MHHLERLSIVCTDPDLEPNNATVGIVDDPAHFETPHLAEQHTMLDARGRPTLDNQTAQFLVSTRGRVGDGQGGSDRRVKRAALRTPGCDRKGERATTPCEHSRIAITIGDHVQRASPSPTRPHQSSAQSIPGSVVKEDPRLIVLQQRRAGSEHDRLGVDATAEVVANQRPQFDTEQPATTFLCQIGIVLTHGDDGSCQSRRRVLRGVRSVGGVAEQVEPGARCNGSTDETPRGVGRS